MHTFEFRIILDNLSEMTIDATNRLYEAGCDDGTPGSSQGISHVDFHRRGQNFQEAVESAIADVKKAGYRVSRIETDESTLVNQINEGLAV